MYAVTAVAIDQLWFFSCFQLVLTGVTRWLCWKPMGLSSLSFSIKNKDCQDAFLFFSKKPWILHGSFYIYRM